jgi:hypothetical protein
LIPNPFTQVISGRVQVSLDGVKRFQDVDGLFDADAGVEDVVLAVVRPEQLVHYRRPDGNDRGFNVITLYSLSLPVAPSEELYFTLLVISAVKTVLSISQNGISPITLNKQLGNHLNMDNISASTTLPRSILFMLV